MKVIEEKMPKKHGAFLCAKTVWSFNLFFGASFARIRERRPAFFCPQTALWCGSTRYAEGWGYADLRGDREGRKLADQRRLSFEGLEDMESPRRPSRSQP